MQDITLTTKFDISSADTDFKSRLRLGALVNYLIQSAIQSADSLGFGFNNLSEQKLIWVLSRMNVEIYEPLQWYDVAEVETWPKNIERIFYLRDFIVRNQHGTVVAKATSAWLAIDLDSRRPKNVAAEHIEKFTRLQNKHALECAPEKLLPVKGDLIATQKAVYSDIDLNKHVTSTRYIDWMMDTLDLDYHTDNYPNKFAINFNKETLPGEQIDISCSSNNHKHAFEGLNKTNNQVAFRGKIEF